MPAFLYYLPGRGLGFTPKDAAGVGLGYALEGELHTRQCFAGPDGGKGLLVGEAQSCPAARVGYFQDEQRWRRVPGSPAWAGMFVQEPPGPADCARARMLDGHPVLLGDGNTWQIPIARALADDQEPPACYCALPRTIDWNDQGERITGEVLPRYRALWDAAALWFDAKSAAELEERMAICRDVITREVALTAIAGNYRIGKAEAGMLGLLTEACEIEVCNALIDWPAWERYLQKKTGPDTSSSTAGPPADIAPTGPPLPTCSP